VIGPPEYLTRRQYNNLEDSRVPEDDPLRILKMRFAKEEISEEEYRKQKAVLLE
jgi:uncharacterized membrane protein